jgi:hypothetical protein
MRPVNVVLGCFVKARLWFFVFLSAFLVSCDKPLIHQALGPILKVTIDNMQGFPNCALSALAGVPSIINVARDPRDSRRESITFDLYSPKLKTILKGGLTISPFPNIVDIEVCGSLVNCRVEDSELSFVNGLLLEASARVSDACK